MHGFASEPREGTLPPMPTTPDVAHNATRGRIVIAVTFVNLVLFYGIWYSYSVFLVTLLREFGWSRSLVSGVFSTFLAVHGSLAPVVGWLLARFGPRRGILWGTVVMAAGLVLAAETTRWWHLYLAFGGVAAVGATLGGWIPSVVLVRGWFPDRVGTAIGIASSGIGVGIFTLVPLTQLLIDAYGWRWAYRLLAIALVAWVLPATLALIRDPAPADGSPTGRASRTSPVRGSSMGYWTLAAASRTWRFWGVAAVYLTGNFVTQMLLIHQIAYLVDHGVPGLTAAALGGSAGLVSIAGKIGWGTLSDRTTRTWPTASPSPAWPPAWAAWSWRAGIRRRSPALYAALIGLGYGVMAPVPPALASDLYHRPGLLHDLRRDLHLGAFGLARGPGAPAGSSTPAGATPAPCGWGLPWRSCRPC